MLRNTPFYAWFVWLLAGLFYSYEFIHRVAPSVMVPELMLDYQVSAQAIGVLSASYIVAYGLMQIPVGMLLDYFGLRRLLSLAALSVAAGSYLFATTDNINLAAFSRILIGFGSAFSFVGCLKIAANYFPAKRFALLIGLTNMLGVLGAIFGSKPLAYFVDHLGWRQCMYFSAFVGACFSLLLAAFVQDKGKDSQLSGQALSYLFLDSIKAILPRKAVWLTALFGFFMVAPIAAFSELWGVSYLSARFALSKSEAAFISAHTFVGIGLGAPFIGWLSDQLKARKSLMLFGALTSLISCSTIFFIPDLSLAAVRLFHFLFGFGTSSMLLCFSINVEQTPHFAKATVIGFTNTLVVASGMIFQPLIGWILDRVSDGVLDMNEIFSPADYQLAFWSLIACQLSAIAILPFIKDKYSSA